MQDRHLLIQGPVVLSSYERRRLELAAPATAWAPLLLSDPRNARALRWGPKRAQIL